jgi:hypothetical protein
MLRACTSFHPLPYATAMAEAGYSIHQIMARPATTMSMVQKYTAPRRPEAECQARHGKLERTGTERGRASIDCCIKCARAGQMKRRCCSMFSTCCIRTVSICVTSRSPSASMILIGSAKARGSRS